MKAYTNVSRKTVGEDRVAICPNFGCEFISRVKPLKFGFLGFGKYPKCRKHRIPLVYIDERISDFVDAALACLFDKSGLPPHELHESIKSKFPNEFNSFIEGWVYCITVGRGAPRVSHYMDTISNAYLKQLTKKQIKALKKGDASKPNLVNKAIKEGMDEITIQYTRVLKHLRARSEILIEHQKLKSLSKSLRNCLNDWQKNILKLNEIINSSENRREMALKETKFNYDQILNVGICRCLLGLNPESKELKKAKITAFDRFSAYHEFYTEGLTVKFTKSDIRDFYSYNKEIRKNLESSKFSKQEIEFFKNHDIEWTVLKSRWVWVEHHPELITAFITEVIAPQHEGRRITKNDLRNLKFRGLEEAIKKTNKSWTQLMDEAGFTSGKPGGHYISETEKNTIYDITKRAIDRYLDSDNKNKPSPLSELTKAEGLNVTNKTFIKYAKEYLIGRFGEKKGIDLFCKRWLGITSEELLFLRKYNYDPEGLKSRWDWLNKSLAIRFYKEIIRPKFDHTPIWEELKNTLGGFRNKLKLRTGLTYNQLITESADSPSSPCDFKKVKKKEFNDEELNFFKNYNIDWRNLKTRWDWIINDPKPPHLSIAFFKEVLYPLENGVPHQEILRRVGYRTFFEKINEIGETWESLVTKAGYQYRPPVQTECIPENKTQLIWQITQDSVDSFLKEDIIPPPIYILVYINSLDINRGTFAKYARNYLIDTYGEMRGNELFDSMWSVALHLTLGRINHILINRVLTKNFNQYNIKFISEPNIYPTQRPDGVLLIDEYTIQFFSQNHAVLNFLGISINDLKNVKLIVFDYTSDISDARVVKKIKKYQHPEVFLFIVGTRWCGDVLMKTLPDSNEIKFPGNIRIINYKVLYSLVRFSTKLIQMFDLIVKLSELNKLDVLESLIESYKIELYKTDMLKDILIKQKKIIFKINEYLDFGKREYKIKTTLSKEEINCITDPIYLAERVIVIDIETTGFDSSLDKIIEIDIVELNLKTKEKIILFNSPIYEEGVDLQKNSESFTMSSLNYSDIIDAPSLESLKNTLQLIFDNFRMTSFNMNFDLRFLESRGFIFPKKLKDMMSHTREILPKGDKYNFEYAYHFFNNSSKNKGGNYLSDADYIQQHQAIDDAMYEVELLYFLYHEFKYPLDYQREITNNINKS